MTSTLWETTVIVKIGKGDLSTATAKYSSRTTFQSASINQTFDIVEIGIHIAA